MSNTNNFCNNPFVIYNNCCPIKKNKYILQDFASRLFLTLLWFLWQYKNSIVTFDHYNSFKNNFTTTVRHAEQNHFKRKFTKCSNNSRDTWRTLNSFIRFKNASKDVTLNNNGYSISDPSVIAEVFNNYFSNIASILIAIFLIQIIFRLNFLGAPVENSFFCPPLTVKKLLT